MEAANNDEDVFEDYVVLQSSRASRDQMKHLMKSSPLTVKILADRFKIPENNILDVFLCGSRLWGTATASGDYDVVIVVAKAQQARSSLHNNADIDACVVTEEVWRVFYSFC